MGWRQSIECVPFHALTRGNGIQSSRFPDSSSTQKKSLVQILPSPPLNCSDGSSLSYRKLLEERACPGRHDAVALLLEELDG
jgi:hypothetical protein